ncbi:MAG: UDP-2,3-diacylglucosamine diphosphatase [Gammaproteobacteria bacterium]|nr:MAG: UDP-2,3-diacylglucosamine diphosphatase [Gammaproteobacteria bacterium]
MATLFISDLHLCSKRPLITELFLDFLKEDAVSADALYILGDFYEFWVGDDVAMTEEYRPITEALQALTSRGVPVYILPGNRDFLLGKDFEALTGCEILTEPYRLDLYGRPTLLMHGDSLCTDDVEYQEFRKQVRDPGWQTGFLAKSLQDRINLFNKYRRISMEVTANKPTEIMDTNQQTIEQVMQQHDATLLIHGHTHRPDEHHFEINKCAMTRIVLADWDGDGSVLRVDKNGWAVKKLSASQLKPIVH